MEKSKWLRGLGCFLALTVALALFLTATPMFAQTAGVILGVVKDTSGGSIPDAKVTVTNTGTNDTRSTTSGDDGSWRVPGLNPGNYTVKIEKDGFKTSTQTGIALDVAQQFVVNPVMEVGAATQEVTVTGEAPIVNTTTSSLGGLVNDQQMADLPLNGRNYMDLTLLQPGVQENSHPAGGGAGATGTWYSSNGAPPRSNNFTLDGAITTNQYGTGANSEANTTLGVDGIKEYKVVTSMFSADYGMSMGSQLVIVTKSGTNNWHGDAFEYLRNNDLDARNFFDYGYTIPAGQPGHVNRLPQFQFNNFGASTGGPIRKDKTFFYVVYEGLRGRTGATILDSEPPAACHNLVSGGVTTVDIDKAGPITPGGNATLSAADAGTCGVSTSTLIPAAVQPWLGQLPIPNIPGAGNTNNYTYTAAFKTREDYSQLRIDQNISNNDTFFGRYTFDDAYLQSPFANIQIQTVGTALPQYNTGGRSRNQWTTFGENHIFSPTLLNSIRLSYSRTNFFVFPIDETVAGVNDFGPLVGPNWSAVTGYGGAWAMPGYTGPSYLGTSPAYHVQNLFTLADDVFLTKGKNAFKFGFLGNEFQDPNVISKGLAGGLSFTNVQQFMSGTPSSISAFISAYPGYTVGCPPAAVGTASCLLTGPGNNILLSPYNGNAPDRDFEFKTFGFYAQDDYRATNRLTLNLGLRYEFQTTFHELYNRETTLLDIQHAAFVTACPTCQMDDPSYKNFSPRVGFAWDVFGTGKTSVRSGFGIYYDVGNYGAMLTQVPTGFPPFSAQTNFTFSSSSAQPTFNQSATPCVLGSVGSCSITLPVPYNFIVPQNAIGRNLQGNDYNMKQPYSLQYNLTVEQQLPFAMGLSVSYVGYRGIHLITGEEGNPVVPQGFIINGSNVPVTFSNGAPVMPVGFGAGIPYYNTVTGLAQCSGAAINPAFAPPAAGNAYPCRVNPYWGSYELYTAGAESWYNSLQVVVNKRVTHGLSFQAAYTWSHAIDDTEGQMFGDDCAAPGAAIGQNPQSPQLDKGNACFDSPNSFHVNFLYHFPNMKGEGAFSKLTNGWWMSSIATLQQGFFQTPTIAKQRSFNGVIAQTGADNASLNTTTNTVTFPVAVAPGNPTPAAGCNVNAAGTAASCTYTFIPYNPSTVVVGKQQEWFNPLMFGETPLGQLGNSGRDTLPGPPERNWDFSIVKDTKLGFLGEQGNLEFRAEIFNILNHTNFGAPGTAFYTGTGNTLGSGGSQPTSSVYLPGTTAASPGSNLVNACNTGLAGCTTSGITLGQNIQGPGSNNATDINPLGNVGQATTTRTNSRVVQFALKIIF